MKLQLVVVLGALFAGGVAEAKEQTQAFSVEGWSCAGCAKKTVKLIGKLKGVSKAESDLDKKSLVVTFEDSVVKAADIEQAIKASKPGCD